MSCPNYKIIFNDETNYVAQDISEEPVVRVIPAKGEQGETGPKGEDGKNFEPTVVSELPETGEENKLYLTPKNYTRSTATGNPITATITAQAGQIESFQLDGDTYQQSYSGSNLLNATPATSGGLNGLSTTIENDGSIHLTGVSTANYSNFLAAQSKTLAAGNYVLSVDKNLPFKVNLRAVYSDSTSETFYRASELDLPISFAKQVTSFYVYAGSTISGTTYNETFKVWLSSGSTATSYEPFVGGQPSPNPDYPQPIQTVTGEQTVTVVGKNLLNLADKTTTERGVSINMSNGNVLSLDGTATSTGDSFYYYSANIKITQDSVLSGNVLGGTEVDGALLGLKLRIQRSDGTGYWASMKVGEQMQLHEGLTIAQFYLGLTSGTVFTNYKVGIQLEKGSTASAYTPYSSTDYPINLGKNLFDKDNYSAKNIYVGTNGKLASSANAGTWSVYIKCEPSTTYTVSKTNAGTGQKFCVFNTSQEPAGGINTLSFVGTPSGDDASTSYTITTGTTASYLGVYLRNGTQTSLALSEILDTLQIEKGSQATTYAPYKTPIELCKLGTYQDYIWKDGEDWKVHKETTKTRLNSDIQWITGSFEQQKRIYYLASGIFGVRIVNPSDNSQKAVALSSHFAAVPLNDILNQTSDGFGISSSAYMSIRVGNATAASDILDILQNNIVMAYAALKTPSETVITDQTLIAQLEAIRTASLQNGSNIITNTSADPNLAGDMEISYYSYNPRNRYDKWLWLDINNEYEQLNNPDTTTAAATETTNLSSGRNLSLTNIQSDSNEIKNDEEQENEILDDTEEKER